MKRRAVLAGAGGSLSLGLGGCTSITGLGGTATELSVVSTPRLSPHGVEFRVEVERSDMGGEDPPLVRLVLENKREEPIDRYDWESSLWVGLSREKKVHLEQSHVAEENDFEVYVEQMGLPLPAEAGCWFTDRAGSPPWHSAGDGVIQPGETVSKSYIVLGMHENLEGECPHGYFSWDLGYPGKAYDQLRLDQTPQEDIELTWEFRLKFD